MKVKMISLALTLLVLVGLVGAWGCTAPAPASSPTPTLTPSLTPTPSPTLKPTPTPTPTLSPSPTPIAVANIFKFAHISPFSGSAAGWGIAQSRAMKYAIEDVGGKIVVAGQPYEIQLIDYDSEYKVDKGVDAINRAISFDKVQFLTALGGSIVQAAVPITEKNKVFFLANVLASKEVINPDHPLTFAMMINCAAFGPAVYYPELIKQFGVKKLAILNPDDGTGYMHTSAVKDVVKAANIPLEVVSEEYFVRGTQDFTPVILRILAKKPDLIDTGTGAANDVGLFLKQVRDAGYTGLTVNTGSIADPAVLWNIAGERALGHFCIGVSGTPPTPLWTAFQQRYEKQFNEKMNAVAPYAYDEVKNLFKAIEKAGTFDPMTVAKVYQDMEWEGVYGHFRWGGTEPVYGFGIKRQPVAPFPMGRVGKGGVAEDWLVKGLQ